MLNGFSAQLCQPQTQKQSDILSRSKTLLLDVDLFNSENADNRSNLQGPSPEV